MIINHGGDNKIIMEMTSLILCFFIQADREKRASRKRCSFFISED